MRLWGWKECAAGWAADSEYTWSWLTVPFPASVRSRPWLCSGHPCVSAMRVRAARPASSPEWRILCVYSLILFYMKLLIKHVWNSAWDLIGHEYSSPWRWLLWNAGLTMHYCTLMNNQGSEGDKGLSTTFCLGYGIRDLKLASKFFLILNFIVKKTRKKKRLLFS